MHINNTKKIVEQNKYKLPLQILLYITRHYISFLRRAGDSMTEFFLCNIAGCNLCMLFIFYNASPCSDNSLFSSHGVWWFLKVHVLRWNIRGVFRVYEMLLCEFYIFFFTGVSLRFLGFTQSYDLFLRIFKSCYLYGLIMGYLTKYLKILLHECI